MNTNYACAMDAVALLQTLPAGSVAAVITDPPFFVSIGRNSGKGGQGGDPWLDHSEIADMVEWSRPLATEMCRVLRPGGAAVVMGGSQSLSAWEIAAEESGLTWMAELVVLWNTGKPRARNFGGLTTTIRWHIKPGARHVFNSDKRSIYSNVLVCRKIPFEDRVHPAQKPVELTNFFVTLLTEEQDLVVDPFCGSGSTLVSAAMTGRCWIGGDRDPEFARDAQRRAQHYFLEENGLDMLHLWINGRLYPVVEEDAADDVNDSD